MDIHLTVSKVTVLVLHKGPDRVSFKTENLPSTTRTLPPEVYFEVTTAHGYGLEWVCKAFGLPEAEVEVIAVNPQETKFSREGKQ